MSYLYFIIEVERLRKPPKTSVKIYQSPSRDSEKSLQNAGTATPTCPPLLIFTEVEYDGDCMSVLAPIHIKRDIYARMCNDCDKIF